MGHFENYLERFGPSTNRVISIGLSSVLGRGWAFEDLEEDTGISAEEKSRPCKRYRWENQRKVLHNSSPSTCNWQKSAKLASWKFPTCQWTNDVTDVMGGVSWLVGQVHPDSSLFCKSLFFDFAASIF